MATNPQQYDAIILGSGQGGNPLAYKLASQGSRIALVESNELGGTCINTGCTPTKTMVASAQVAHYARNAQQWGVKAGPVSVDLPAVVARKQKMVEKFRAGWQNKMDKQPSLDLHRGVGKFVGLRQIEVAGRVLEAPRVFIDTGTTPIIPDFPGLEHTPYLTNATLMELTSLPAHLIVIGGGYVGLEFGQMFRRFGSEVTIIHRSARVLGREDANIIEELQKALTKEGVRLVLDAGVSAVQANETSVSVDVTRGGAQETVTGSHMLLAVGRKPNTAELDLEKTGVSVDDRGFIKVNSRLETSAEGIWALGDVNGGPAFTHISYNDFQIVYGNLYENKSLSTDGRILPYAVFTDPPLGRVGITEAQARSEGRSIKVGSVPMTSVARGMEKGETKGLMKIVVNASDDQVLGASILASEGPEVVQILHTLMLAKQPYTLLKGAIYIHPTIAEGFFSLLESVKPI